MLDALRTAILLETIRIDCEKLTTELDADYNYIYLQECKDSKENGMYQLVLDGHELWYGTLNEINAVVKSLLAIKCSDHFPSIKLE